MNLQGLVGIKPGEVLADRYRILKLLGQGGFGRTYLAEDIHRFKETCVLKEFVPQKRDDRSVQKALSLFQREADVLYRLRHPQIPQFRELLQTQYRDQDILFLVQSYIPGKTYRHLLQERQVRGLTFQEAEIIELLYQLLPVLAYLHANGVIHRDISPDNLIQGQENGLPFLIDFGGVKQAAFGFSQANSQGSYPGSFSSGSPASYSAGLFPQPWPGSSPSSILTCIGKAGYAPPEQLQQGKVYPHSDLYALAVTALVLLTGQEPQGLIDPQTLEWQWRQAVRLSSPLGNLFDGLLASQPGDRYPSASAVLLALSGADPNAAIIPLPPLQSPSPAAANLPSPEQTSTPVQTSQEGRKGITVQPKPRTDSFAQTSSLRILPRLLSRRLALVPLLVLITGLGSWGVSQVGQAVWRSQQASSSPPSTFSAIEPIASFSAVEKARKTALVERRQALGIEEAFLVELVNEQFYPQHLELQGKFLTTEPNHADLRAEWDQQAAQLLEDLEWLHPNLRQKLGTYQLADFEHWVEQVNSQFLSRQALIDLTNNQFFYHFPNQSLEPNVGDAQPTPWQQIWWAIAEQTTRNLLDRKTLTEFKFEEGTSRSSVTKTLEPGDGMVYLVYLVAKQPVQFQLQAPENVRLSIYPPASQIPPLLADSSQRTWEGVLPTTGYYEIVVMVMVPRAAELRLTVRAEVSDRPEDAWQKFLEMPSEGLDADPNPASDLFN